MTKYCSVNDCNGKVIAKNFCSKHYQRFKKHGDPLIVQFEVKTRKAIDHDDGTRTCAECLKRKPLIEFHKDSKASGGYRARCADCHTNSSKDWYKKNQPAQKAKATIRRILNADKIREQDSQRYLRNKDKRLELASKHSQIRRARKANSVFDKGISKNSLRRRLGDKCYYCNVVMDFSSTSKAIGFKDEHATIEHLIPLSTGGTHTWGNVVLACRKCNIRKHNKSPEEWNKHIQKSEQMILSENFINEQGE